MGVSNSTYLQEPFKELSSWPGDRAAVIAKAYSDGAYDFGVDAAVVRTITGMSMDEASAVVAAHSKNDAGIVNALSLLITFICLPDPNQRNESLRLRQVFDLFDFNKASQMSIDELTILLICVTSAFSFVLGRKERVPADSLMINNAHAIYAFLGKKNNAPITRDELQSWASGYLWKQPGGININSVFETLVNGVEDSLGGRSAD